MKKVTYREIKITPPEGVSISEEEVRDDVAQAKRLHEIFSANIDTKEHERRIERAFDVLFERAWRTYQTKQKT